MIGVNIAASENLYSFTACGHTRLQIFTLIYGVCFGLSNGLGYTVPLRICWDLLPNNRGIVTGIVTCGFGFGQFVFSTLSTYLINPLNLPMETVEGENNQTVYGHNVTDNLMSAQRKLSVIYCCLTLIVLVLI